MIPFIPKVKNIKALDEEHAEAIRCLHLLREVNKALMNNDLKSAINYRKQLKMENAALYEVYFNMLKQRK